MNSAVPMFYPPLTLDNPHQAHAHALFLPVVAPQQPMNAQPQSYPLPEELPMPQPPVPPPGYPGYQQGMVYPPGSPEATFEQHWGIYQQQLAAYHQQQQQLKEQKEERLANVGAGVAVAAGFGAVLGALLG
jgi:hypothetical protein